ncbi:PAS/PAC sensor signal transduction histidine kinase [Mucilaginibacter mallensis]|uniref:histidine kinase n=1 Tax=Mucilaginibacter mallensis TaxID=652787 RepID=A0A1H2BP00_MUCMA|nr:ATP-binding protein [Mucilaginibacter mallensis]SDT59649.1 PAS/PAC sensor signal transduction histidine kinase [Mucilaginibacter mallensis]
MNIKNKLRAGIGFLFLMALISSGMADYYLTRLSNDSKAILKDNYRSLVYAKNIQQALDYPTSVNTATKLQIIEANVSKEEQNITEPGEGQLADSLRGNFEQYKLSLNNQQAINGLNIKMRNVLYNIMQLNMAGIERRNAIAQDTADKGIILVSLIGSLCFLIAFSFVWNFPGYIANPVKELIQGIKEIANKNYNKRLIFPVKDEFGDLADAFNQMAGKLNEYENSNLASIIFEKRRIETIINSMHDAIIGIDDKMFIIFANKVACTLIGLPEDKLTAQYAPNIAMENDLLRNMLFVDQHKMKIFADNRESYFEKEVLEVTNDYKVIGKVIILKNITDFQQLNDAKTTFIATISHELKTPLSSIKMSLKLLEDARVGEINTEQKQLLKNIDDDTHRLLHITAELLDAAQVETGKINLNFGSTHPKNIVSYAVQAIKSLADQKELTIAIDCPDTLPNVMADLDKTTWVLINLLSNAVKYSPTKSTINLDVKKSKNNIIEFSVKDSGQGIDEKYLARIFERYFRIPGAAADKTGTGLGLAIAKDFIEAQGGTIGVESEAGEGSRFYFSLNINNT